MSTTLRVEDAKFLVAFVSASILNCDPWLTGHCSFYDNVLGLRLISARLSWALFSVRALKLDL